MTLVRGWEARRLPIHRLFRIIMPPSQQLLVLDLIHRAEYDFRLGALALTVLGIIWYHRHLTAAGEGPIVHINDLLHFWRLGVHRLLSFGL